MAPPPVPEAEPAVPRGSAPREPRGLHTWFLERLDSLLSEKLRGAPPADLVRYRVLVGATVFMLGFDTLAVLLMPQVATRVMLILLALGYLGVLRLTRRASSPTPPALLLCISISLAFFVGGFTVTGYAYLGTHSAHMLVPALAVYLVGPRLGLIITLGLMVAQTLIHPLFVVDQTPAQDSYYWPMHIVSAISFVGAWGLSALHSTARDEAQASLERTLKSLRESVTAYQEAEVRLGELHRTLVDVSRQAGMTEVATGVLHNVGNTLNSVNISTELVIEQLRKSRVPGLTKAVALLREHSSELGTYLTTDRRGQTLPHYLTAVAGELQAEHETMLREMKSLRESVDHIKSIVTMQQRYAKTGGTLESLHIPQLIDEALRLHAVSFERQGILIDRQYEEVPPIIVDRHKLLQILVNLLSNARHALADSGKEDKRLIIRVHRDADGQRLLLEVSDNGKGIAPENLQRVFTQGFTTKRTGHGFGLHISAVSAKDMKGRLTCTSAGLGQGATFTLELPVQGPQDEPPEGP